MCARNFPRTWQGDLLSKKSFSFLSFSTRQIFQRNLLWWMVNFMPYLLVTPIFVHLFNSSTVLLVYLVIQSESIPETVQYRCTDMHQEDFQFFFEEKINYYLLPLLNLISFLIPLQSHPFLSCMHIIQGYSFGESLDTWAVRGSSSPKSTSTSKD